MALIPPNYIDCVVAIGADSSQGERRWIASGFFYGAMIKDFGEGQARYQTYLITNRHVFEKLATAYIRCNPKGNSPAQEFPLSLVDDKGAPLWFAHSNSDIDVAVAPVQFKRLVDEGMQVSVFKNNTDVGTIETLNSRGVTEGDFAYVLGFPMEQVGVERNTVIVRSGTIARIRDALSNANHSFLVDASVFPGNSGGPVILKPEAGSIQGTQAQDKALLIGIATAYIPYHERAISEQTGEPRVIFRENSGLASVHVIDYVEELVQDHLQTAAIQDQPSDERKTNNEH